MVCQNVTSTNIKTVCYNSVERTLRIVFYQGGVYDYQGVPEKIFKHLLGASSKGSFFTDFIKDRYQTLRIA
ncbi:MAG: KTSC domain-containing protein [Spirochaetota bacterium]